MDICPAVVAAFGTSFKNFAIHYFLYGSHDWHVWRLNAGARGWVGRVECKTIVYEWKSQLKKTAN